MTHLLWLNRKEGNAWNGCYFIIMLGQKQKLAWIREMEFRGRISNINEHKKQICRMALLFNITWTWIRQTWNISGHEIICLLERLPFYSLSCNFLACLQWQALHQHSQYIATLGSTFPQRTCSTTIKTVCKSTRKAQFPFSYCHKFSERLDLYKIVFLCSPYVSVKWMQF